MIPVPAPTRPARGLLFLLLALGLVLPGRVSCAEKSGEAVYYPPPESKGGWRALVPAHPLRGYPAPSAEAKQKLRDTAGIDWDKLQEAWKYCAGFGGPNSLLVVRRGWVVGEWHDFTNPRGIASCTKSLTALATAKLFDLSDAGKLPKKVAVEDEAWRFLPARWAEAEPARQKIRLRHLLTMMSGLTPYDGPYRDDYETRVFAQTVEAPPGTVWDYAVVAVDPRTGAASDLGKVTGGTYTARLPREKDAVLVIRAAKPDDTVRARGEVLDADTGKPIPSRVYVQREDGEWFFPGSASANGTAVPYRVDRLITVLEQYRNQSSSRPMP